MHYVLVLKHNIIKAGFFVTIYFYVWSAFTLMSLPDTMRVSSDHIYLAKKCVGIFVLACVRCIWSTVEVKCCHRCFTRVTEPSLTSPLFYAFMLSLLYIQLSVCDMNVVYNVCYFMSFTFMSSL